MQTQPNQSVSDVTYVREEPKLNGLHCPDCGAQLMDTTPNTTYTSHPAQMKIQCSNCVYEGWRFI